MKSLDLEIAYEKDRELDEKFCTAGPDDAPITNDQMDKQMFGVTWEDQSHTLLVEEWIQSIQDSTVPNPDKLTIFDREVDASIGGFGAALENMLDVQPPRAVPLFEFRRLKNCFTNQMQQRANAADQAVVDLHKKFAVAPKLRKRQTGTMRLPVRRRQDDVNLKACAASTTTASASIPQCTLQRANPDEGVNVEGCICGSTTLPLLTVGKVTFDGQSCSYTALPTSKMPNPISIPALSPMLTSTTAKEQSAPDLTT